MGHLWLQLLPMNESGENPRIGVQYAVMRRQFEKYLNFRETPDEQIGGMKALDTLYDRNKPIDLNETGYYPLGSWYERYKARDVRVEALGVYGGRTRKLQQLECCVHSSRPSRKGGGERARSRPPRA